MIVSKLCIYPLKSCQRIELQQTHIRTKGLDWDREMMLVAGNGKFITQRQFPQLAKVMVEIGSQSVSPSVTLSVADQTLPALVFTPVQTGTTIEVEIWRDRVLAVDQGNEVAQWFHQLLNLELGKVCRLVRQSSEHTRVLAKKYPSDSDSPINFADNYPIMLTATASLEELNQRIVDIYKQQQQPISMNRFRPNIVLETIEPFVEDTWSLIQIGRVKFSVVKPCSRCIITTVDQKKGEKNPLKEPLNTLGTFRQFSDQGVLFGENMIPQDEGIIQVGDRLQVLETRN